MGYISDIRKKVGHDPVFMPAVGCIIIKDGKILLQKRTDNGTWAVHGGALDLGETYIEALNRELKEEINITPINPIAINTYSGEDMHFFYPNKDEVYVVAVMYLAEDYEGELKPDMVEVSELKWFDIDEIPENINKTDIHSIYDAIELYKKNH